MSDQQLLITLEHLIPEISDKILSHYFQNTTAQRKADGSIVTEADLAMQLEITHELQRITPQIRMISEEMSEQQQIKVVTECDSYWCLDPVDGTNNFHHGVPLFAVSLALIKNRELALGLVYDPIRKELFSAAQGTGLRINGQTTVKTEQPLDMGKCLASVDFKRLKAPMKQRLFEKMPFKSQRNIGTCALEWAWLAAGRTQLLLHGGEKFWDYAAGCLLLAESAGMSSTDTHSPIFNNSLDNRPVIAASTQHLYQQWSSFLLD
ncbi:MAG: inositol monophosphatase family protein [Gammaproteobacteria bacterium]|nr:inositol monophosphatase family protein [Gammaproteobacteria bacterium]